MTNLADNWLPRHRLTVEEFHRMGETGILRPDARVELIEGEIIDMAPIGSRHAATVTRMVRIFTETCGNAAHVWVQNPIVLDNHSEPEPDIVLVRPRQDFYEQALPRGSDSLLVVEVSETTLRYDREVKLPLYARHGIPEAWIVDLGHRVLLAFADPVEETYRVVRSYPSPGKLSPLLLPDCAVDLSGIF